MPGLAKTLALKTLAGTLKAEFKRLQFTPDMLPADGRSEERAILDAMATSEPSLGVRQVVSTAEITSARLVVNRVYVDDRVKDYIVDLIAATRTPQVYGMPIASYIQYGASPRGTISLTLAAKAWAFLHGRGYVTPRAAARRIRSTDSRTRTIRAR